LVTLNYAIIYQIIYLNNLKALYQRRVVHNYKLNFDRQQKLRQQNIIYANLGLLVVFAVAKAAGYSCKCLINVDIKSKRKASKLLIVSNKLALLFN
jgi:hypothetical protein